VFVLPEIPTKTWKMAGIVLAASALAAVAWLAMRSASQAEVPPGGTPKERAKAVEQIAVRHAPRAVEALAAAATKDPSPVVRRTAMAGMTRHADVAHRQVFEQGVRDPDASVRAIAADNLAAYRDQQTVEELIGLVHDDPDEQVRLAALRGLAECDDPRAIVVLLQTGESGKTSAMRLQGMKSLLRKFHGKLSPGRAPDNEAKWRDLIQGFKRDLRVKNAFAAAGVSIDDRPGDLLTKDLHGERPGRPAAAAP
jgi:hypothetical protein